MKYKKTVIDHKFMRDNKVDFQEYCFIDYVDKFLEFNNRPFERFSNDEEDMRKQIGFVSVDINITYLLSINALKLMGNKGVVPGHTWENRDGSDNDQGALEEFKRFHKAYPGRKRGADTEFLNLKKKYPKEYGGIVSVITKAILSQKEVRSAKKSKGRWVPEWKNMSVWINNKCWEEIEEMPTSENENKPKTYLDVFGR